MDLAHIGNRMEHITKVTGLKICTMVMEKSNGQMVPHMKDNTKWDRS